MRKTKYILESIVKQGKKVDYYALDLSEETLRASLLDMMTSFPTINFIGLLGTYEDSLPYINQNIPSRGTPKVFFWLGSSIGNFTRSEATTFLKSIHDQAMETGDVFFCGIDKRNDPAVVGLAYNDTKGLTREFIMNGLDHCNDIFGQKLFDRSQFEYISTYNDKKGRHEAYYRSLTTQTLKVDSDEQFPTVELKEGELIHIEYSHKYSDQEVFTMADDLKMNIQASWNDKSKLYGLHALQKPPFYFPKRSPKDLDSVPSKEEFNELWKAW